MSKNRTGKFGFIYPDPGDNPQAQAYTDDLRYRWAGVQLAEKISDGRDYQVSLGFHQQADSGSGLLMDMWRCRLTIFLTDYKDAEVGEHCLFPYIDSDPHGQCIDGFETRYRDVTDQERADGCKLERYPQRVHVETGAVFEGWGIWQRVE